jgi:hypothetical protein
MLLSRVTLPMTQAGMIVKIDEFLDAKIKGNPALETPLRPGNFQIEVFLLSKPHGLDILWSSGKEDELTAKVLFEGEQT